MKNFWNTVPACVLPKKSFRKGVSERSVTKKNTPDYNYSNDNENKLQANKGRLVLYVAIYFQVLPTSLFMQNKLPLPFDFPSHSL
jgi:hypothetical protein